MKILPKIFRSGMVVAIGFMLFVTTSGSAAMNDYCSVPPFLSPSVHPNVMIVLDNSGSMRQPAYLGDYDPDQFEGGQYYGYFDASQNYLYDGTRWIITDKPIADATFANPIASGNFLNWATMRRVDIAKKVLIGGKADPRIPSGTETVKLVASLSSTPDFDKNFQSDADSTIIGPFVGDHRYRMNGDFLEVTQVYPEIIRPVANNSIPAGWSVFSAVSAFEAVNEVDANDQSYVTTTSSGAPLLFDYSFAANPTEKIHSVTVKVRARKSNVAKRMNIQAVLRVNGENKASSNQQATENWGTYTFAWPENPETGLAWQWSELQELSSADLNAFGVRAVSTPTADNQLFISQIFLEIETDATAGQNYKLVVDQGSTPATGLLHSFSDQVRLGLAYYNGNSEGGHVEKHVDFNALDDIVVSINDLFPQSWTPLAETVFEMVNYFRQDSDRAYADSNYGVGDAYDPYYFTYPAELSPYFTNGKVKCADSFILLMTDGLSTQDQNIPEGVPPGAADGEQRTLRNFDEDENEANAYPDNGSDYLDDVALWARTTDLRSDIEGEQNLFLYPISMFGQGAQLLKDAAKNGGFVESEGGDRKPGPELFEYLRDSSGDGILSVDDDLPRTYFEAADGFELEKSLTEAFNSMISRPGSGSAVSLLSSSTRGAGAVVNAYYQYNKGDGDGRNEQWPGYLQGFWLDGQDNLREDTLTDARLQLAKDKVVKMYYDIKDDRAEAALFTTDDAGFGGTLEECGPKDGDNIEYVPFNAITPIWEAGSKLANRGAAGRDLFTSKKVISSAKTRTITDNDFTVTNTASGPLHDALNQDVSYSASEIVSYIRGENLEATNNKFRDRRQMVKDSTTGQVVLKPWLLGDIVNSTPKTISNFPVNSYHTFYGDYTYFQYFTTDEYRNRSALSVLGANDGMVHAFRLGYLKDRGFSAEEQQQKVKAKYLDAANTSSKDNLGEEVWGYIPFNAFPYLKYLANPEYCHLYYNDLPLKLVDASLGAGDTPAPDGAKGPSSWRSLLLGGMRFGGSCNGGTPAPPAGVTDVGYSAFYVLDVTKPEIPEPLWEFSDTDLGYATSSPGIVRIGGKATNGHWSMVVGSGSKQLPKWNTDIARNSSGYLYFIDLKTGALKKKIALGFNAIVGDILSVDANKDYYSEKLYFGTSYQAGNEWRGKLLSLKIPHDDLDNLCGSGIERTAADCGEALTVLFEDVYPFTASPDAILGELNQTWVFQGSGKYYSNLDGIDSSNQIFLGIKDVDQTLDITELDDSTLIKTRGSQQLNSVELCLYDEASDAFKETTVFTAISPTGLQPPSAKGWYLTLTGGERVISRPLGFGGLVDFLTYKPRTTQDPCQYQGDTFLYAVDYRNGTAPAEVAIPLSGAIESDSGEYVVKKGVKLGPGAPPSGEGIILTPARRGDKSGLRNKKIQVGSGVVYDAKNNPIFDVNSQVMHWLEK